MAGNKLLVYLLTICTVCLLSSYGYYPQVTLKHGGQLSGKRIKFGSKVVDRFVGVRYAKPPVGDLRFKKPEPVNPWTGVKVARSFRDACIQCNKSSNLSVAIGYLGSEDCLFLDISVPGGVSKNKKKPVMIWIHGGGYVFGSGMPYLGAPLALHGDVIVVSINYRLNIFGFLSESLETGNFGLWDQRAAIQWVKDNIEVFGGDPNLITLFGQSAGAGSVAAHMMSKHNDGLFQRGIAQSGSLYQSWGWFATEKKRLEQINKVKQQFECGDLEIYDCLRDKPVDVIWSTLFSYNDLLVNKWHPLPDGDFFPPNIEKESYDLSKRFDLLGGFNEQEGMLMVIYDVTITLSLRNESVNDGISMEATSAYLSQRCSLFIASQSAELCADFIIRTYGLDRASDDKDRLVRLSHFLGEFYFNTDIVNMLKQHSNGNATTYAYTFTPYVKLPPDAIYVPWVVPHWLKKAADHGDELPYVFRSSSFHREKLQSLEYTTDPSVDLFKATKQNAGRSYYEISKNIMTMWTNFAKTGNPNQPVPLQKNIPVWPEFDKNTQKFMKISENMTVITTPEKERLEKLQNILFPVRTRRVAGEKITEV